MAKGERVRYLKTCRKFDVPLFCGAWATQLKAPDKAKQKKPEEEQLVLLGGGGGDRKHGIKNRLILAVYDFVADELSEEIFHLSMGDEPPFQLAVHPNGLEVVAAFEKSCRLFTLHPPAAGDGEETEVPAAEGVAGGDESEEKEEKTEKEKTESKEDLLVKSERPLELLEDAGEQKIITFNSDGTLLATGGEDGHLRILDWEAKKLVLDIPEAHSSALKGLDFSWDGSLLATTAASGPCRIWDVMQETPIKTFPFPEGGRFGACVFAREEDQPFLFLSVVKGGKGWVMVYETRKWIKLGVKKLHEEPISALAISPNSKFLATGTAGGDVAITEVKSMTVKQKVPGAHMVFVTDVHFSPDSRAVLSVSGDSSARITAVKIKIKRELTERDVYLILAGLILLSIILAYLFYKYCGSFWKFPLGENQPSVPPLEATLGDEWLERRAAHLAAEAAKQAAEAAAAAGSGGEEL